MIALVDCNNFYASCERVFQPRLQGRPVVVLSNNDGCVISRSEEAKKLGIQMGAPAFLAEAMLQRHGVAVFSSNFTLYGDFSDRVMVVLGSYASEVERYSIDEAFLDLRDHPGRNLTDLATDLRHTVLRNIGIPVSIGMGPTKTLAKMANRYIKQVNRDLGVYCLDSQAKIKEVLDFTPVGDIWGIGMQHKKMLMAHNIRRASDLLRVPADWMRIHMTVNGERLWNELRGIPCFAWDASPPAKKAICVARSFGTPLSAKQAVGEAVANYAASCAAKLRSQHSCAGMLQVFLQTNIHRSDQRQYFRSINLRLPEQTNSSNVLIEYAGKGFARIFREGYQFKKAGVLVLDLVPERACQYQLFDAENKTRNDAVMHSLDAINKHYGTDLIKFATQGWRRQWRLRQEKLSPCYTTKLSQVATINL